MLFSTCPFESDAVSRYSGLCRGKLTAVVFNFLLVWRQSAAVGIHQLSVAARSRPWGGQPRLCSSIRDNVCVISEDHTITRSEAVQVKGDVLVSGSRLQCALSSASFESISISIVATGTISILDGSLVHCATVELNAQRVVISEDSEVSANGTSYSVDPASGSTALRGGSYGGLGGTASIGFGSSTNDEENAARLTFGDPFAPWKFGRAAGRGLGGGRVRVIAPKDFIFNGTLSASGQGPEDVETSEDMVAAGSGGSIWVTTGSLQQPGATASGAGIATPINSGAVDFVDELGASRQGSSGNAPIGGRIIALGGCCERCLCGGGGRVLVEIWRGAAPRHVLAAGGCWHLDGKADGDESRCGSAGTWTVIIGDRRHIQGVRGPWSRFGLHATPMPAPPSGSTTVVHVDNSYAVSLAGAKLPHPTPLASFASPVALVLRDAIVAPTDENPVWRLTKLALRSDQIGSTLKHASSGPLVLNFVSNNQGLELAFSSTLEARELRIEGAQSVTLFPNAAIDSELASISALGDIDVHQGELGQGAGTFVLHARRIVLGGGRLRAALVVADDELILAKGSRLRSSHRRCNQLPAPVDDPCAKLFSGPADPGNRSLLSNVTFDVVLVSRSASITLEEDAEARAAALLICASRNLSINGLVSAEGLGCPPSRGESPGAMPVAGEPIAPHAAWPVLHGAQKAQIKCGGGGGAHCGNGGDGARHKSRTICEGTGGHKYDGWWSSQSTGTDRPSRLPTWSASGGGGMAGGAGGGIVWVRADAVDLLSNGTSISARGDDAPQWAQSGTEGAAGGGAGGTVIINVSLVTGPGMIEASGGRGGGCLGGGGGGGAVGSAGPHASQAWRDFEGNVVADGGLSDGSPACNKEGTGSRGGDGDLLQLGVCRPGEAGIFCALCPPGTYNPPHELDNNTALYRLCLPCENKPPNANYTVAGWLNETCPYACPAGFPPVQVNPRCDDPWTYYIEFFGGVWGVASGAIIIVVFFGFSLSAAQLRRIRQLTWLRKQRELYGPSYAHTDELLFLFESVRGRHPLSDLHFAHKNVAVSNRVAIGVGGPMSPMPTARKLLGRRRWSRSWWRPWRRRSDPNGLGRKTQMFNASDLPHHTVRIYLFGVNSPMDPWYFPMKAPEELKDIVNPRRWESFARGVNSLTAKGMMRQRWTESVLRWIYLPVAEHIRWRIRLSRAAQVAAFVWSWSESSRADQALWRLTYENSSRFSLKFGTDWQMTVAFVDVLDHGKTLQDWAVRPQIPMILVASGDGEYTAPYQVEYSDPYVQSVAQYLGRRTWQQVLLSFNLLARLLPPNPTEQDLVPLRRSMAHVSTSVLGQTDLECHAALFEAPARPVPDAPVGKKPLSRQPSWDTLFQAEAKKNLFANSSVAASPMGCRTPMAGQLCHNINESTLNRRVALVLSQRPAKSNAGRGTVDHGLNSWRRRQTSSASTANQAIPTASSSNSPQLSPYMSPPAGPLHTSSASTLLRERSVFAIAQHGLVSPDENLGVDETQAMTPLDLGGDSMGVTSGEALASSTDCGSVRSDVLRRRLETRQTMHRVSSDPTCHDSDPGLMGLSPKLQGRSCSLHGADSKRIGRTRHEYTGRHQRPGRRPSAAFRCLSRTASAIHRAMMRLCGDSGRQLGAAFVGRVDAAVRALVAPGERAYSMYIQRLRGVKCIGGAGRQTGLCLRHRKPRGNRVTSLFCLLLALLVSMLVFIAQSAVLFRIGPRHCSFFVSLLCPPFADIFALAFGLLFVCGAADGVNVCHFVLASMVNTLFGFLGRLLAMDPVLSTGLLYVIAEYAVAFSAKVVICRLVNLLIAHASAEPLLLEPAVSDADHEWVREHILFRRNSPGNEDLRDEDGQLILMTRRGSQNSDVDTSDWFLQTPAGNVFAGNTPRHSQTAGMLMDYDGWTPCLRGQSRHQEALFRGV